MPPLRSVLILILMVIGAYYTLQAPFYALLVYLAYSYLRPEEWLWINVVPPNFSFVFGAYVAWAAVTSQRSAILKNRLILLCLFVFHSFLSIFFSNYFPAGWNGWLYFLKSIVITYSITVLITDFFQFRSVLLILVLFLGLDASKQGWVYLLFSGWGVNENTIGFLGDNNAVAVGMLMLVPIVALMAQTTQRKWARIGFRFLLIGVIYRALSTYSRGGFLACLALGGVYWLRSRQKLRLLFGIAIVATIVYAALPEQFWARMGTISTSEEETDDSARGRLHFWRVAVAMANANPLLGVGHLCYNAAYNTYDFLHGKYGYGRSVHSAFFGILSEGGYVGATLYGLVILSAFRGCHRVHKLVAKHPTLLALSQTATALETSLVVFVVGGSFVPVQYNEMFWHYIGFTIVLEELAVRYAFSESAVSELPHVAFIGHAVPAMDERA